MDYDAIFAAFYALYRGESTDLPESGDEEYDTAIALANEAVNRWENYDNTYWKTLFNTLQNADDGDTTISTGTTEYDAPSDMREAGGFVKVSDSSNNVVQRYPIIEPQEAQFKGDDNTYAYFTGDQHNGHVLHLNPAPSSSLSGNSIDYVYYKKATKFVSGGDVTEVPDSYFIVNRMLASQFRNSRNPYYGSAKTDAENALKQMKMANDSGTYANPISLADNSGSAWGK